MDLFLWEKGFLNYYVETDDQPGKKWAAYHEDLFLISLPKKTFNLIAMEIELTKERDEEIECLKELIRELLRVYAPCPGMKNCSPARYKEPINPCQHCKHTGTPSIVPMSSKVPIGIVGAIGDWPGMTFRCISCEQTHTGFSRSIVYGFSVCPNCKGENITPTSSKQPS